MKTTMLPQILWYLQQFILFFNKKSFKKKSFYETVNNVTLFSITCFQKYDFSKYHKYHKLFYF